MSNMLTCSKLAKEEQDHKFFDLNHRFHPLNSAGPLPSSLQLEEIRNQNYWHQNFKMNTQQIQEMTGRES